MRKYSLLGISLHSFDRNRLVEIFRSALRKETFRQIATVNPEFLVAAQKSADFFTILKNKTWLNLCDGTGIQILLRIFYGKKIERISGVEIALLLCEICEQEQKSVYLLGGFGVAQKSADFLQKKFPKLIIAGTEDGRHPTRLSATLVRAKPAVILVAFGTPIQEYWLQKFGKKTGARIGVGVGGTFDLWGKKRRRAPKLWQKTGFEWLWRLFQEPSRWSRIKKAVLVFPWIAFLEKFGRKQK